MAISSIALWPFPGFCLCNCFFLSFDDILRHDFIRGSADVNCNRAAANANICSSCATGWMALLVHGKMSCDHLDSQGNSRSVITPVLHEIFNSFFRWVFIWNEQREHEAIDDHGIQYMSLCNIFIYEQHKMTSSYLSSNRKRAITGQYSAAKRRP
jgi:hypothetical protein